MRWPTPCCVVLCVCVCGCVPGTVVYQAERVVKAFWGACCWWCCFKCCWQRHRGGEHHHGGQDAKNGSGDGGSEDAYSDEDEDEGRWGNVDFTIEDDDEYEAKSSVHQKTYESPGAQVRLAVLQLCGATAVSCCVRRVLLLPCHATSLLTALPTRSCCFVPTRLPTRTRTALRWWDGLPKRTSVQHLPLQRTRRQQRCVRCGRLLRSVAWTRPRPVPHCGLRRALARAA